MSDADEVLHVLREAAYVGVGIGVLAYQRAQVRRRELERALEPHVGGACRGASEAVTTLRSAASVVADGAQEALRSMLGGPAGRPPAGPRAGRPPTG